MILLPYYWKKYLKLILLADNFNNLNLLTVIIKHTCMTTLAVYIYSNYYKCVIICRHILCTYGFALRIPKIPKVTFEYCILFLPKHKPTKKIILQS